MTTPPAELVFNLQRTEAAAAANRRLAGDTTEPVHPDHPLRHSRRCYWCHNIIASDRLYLLALLSRMMDTDPCEYDPRTGLCQMHAITTPGGALCPHDEARRVLEANEPP